MPEVPFLIKEGERLRVYRITEDSSDKVIDCDFKGVHNIFMVPYCSYKVIGKCRVSIK